MPSGGVRRKKPTKLKLIHGTFRPDRASENEPKPDPIAPPRPAWVTGRAKEFWERISPRLEKLGLLTELDGDALAMLCDAWADLHHAREYLKKIRAQKNPQQKRLRLAQVSVERARHDVRLLMNEFGFTPAARSRMSVEVGNEEDEFEKFLDGTKPG